MDGSAFDPFVSTVAPITKNIHSTLTYFWINAPTGLHRYKLEVLPEHLQPFQGILKALRETVLGCVYTSKHVLYSFLAAFESRFIVLSGRTSSRRNSAETYITMAMASIHDKVAERQSPLETAKSQNLSLMIGIQYLAIATGLNDRLSEIHLHIRAMMSLVRDLRSVGPGPVEHWLIDDAASVCTLAAVKTGTSLVPYATTEPARLDTQGLAAMKQELELLARHENKIGSSERLFVWSADSPLRGPRSRRTLESIYAPEVDVLADASQTLTLELGSGFVSALALGSIDHRLRMVLCDVLDNLTVTKYVWKWPERCGLEMTKWLCQSNRKALHQLMSIDLQAESINMSGEAPLPRARYLTRMARCVRLALIIMLSCAAYRLGRMCCQSNMPRLRAALLDLEKLTDGFPMSTEYSFDGREAYQRTREEVCNSRLYFWTVMTGHFASQGQPEEQWFAAKASSIAASRLKLRSFADLHRLMSKPCHGSQC